MEEFGDEWNHLLEQTFAVTPTLPMIRLIRRLILSCGSLSADYLRQVVRELRPFLHQWRPLQSGALNLKLSARLSAALLRAPQSNTRA